MLRFGPDTGPVAVVALPLFEEANRVRAFAVTICRALAKRGVASVLPDLPGQGESATPTSNLTLAMLRQAFGAAVDLLFDAKMRPYSLSIRSGALLDLEAHSLGRWRLAPSTGEDLMQGLARILEATGRRDEALQIRTIFQADPHIFPLEIAGNPVGQAFLEGLTTDQGADVLHHHGVPLHTVRLHTDPKPADRHVPGTPLWRRAEPDNDPALAALLAEDIADWIAACEF